MMRLSCRLRRVLALSVIVGTISCTLRDKNRLRIEVVDSFDGRPLFNLVSRDGKAKLLVDRVIVEEVETGVWVCTLEVISTPTAEPMTWRYGQAVAGYRMNNCAVLSPGRYRVGATASGSIGVKEFVVGSPG